MDLLREFHGPNAGYVIALYEQYLEDPESVDAATRALFSRHAADLDGDPSTAAPRPTSDFAPGPSGPAGTASTDGTASTVSTGDTAGPADIDQIVFIANLAQNVREYGHLGAHLDPLADPRYFPYSVFATEDDAALGDPLTELELEAQGVTEETMRKLPSSLIGGPVGQQCGNASEALKKLKRVYSSTTGYDYMHIEVPGEREWLQEAAETGRFRPSEDEASALAILDRLTEVEVFEQFLHRTFPGKTRFSIEGLDTMILILDGVIGEAAVNNTCNILVGMAHRGRLNVLAHILHKPYEHILAEFRDPVQRVNKTGNDTGWTGDVKYHSGAQRRYQDQQGKEVDLHIHLAPNPSHLEAVNPVLEGMARAAGTIVNLPGDVRPLPERNLPILIHGDAAFAGQGVVAETFTLYRVPGFRTGGTIHLITNNQLGYTTPSEQSRSTLYASDIARGFEIPIIHVNADDPVACLEAARIAYAYRVKFRKDFLIDLIGYRRHGHNEGDDPSLTHPSLYRRIDAHPTVRKLWADRLEAEGRIEAGKPEELVAGRMGAMQTMLDELKPEEVLTEPYYEPPRSGTAKRTRSSVSMRRLKNLNKALWTFPDNFTLHPRLKRVIERRRRALDDVDARKIDWAHAEILAFASIIEDGVPVRLTGQDVERGTFSQRHNVLHDYETDRAWTPLRRLPQANASFETRNTPLTEYAALGFEYGYSIQAPERFVLWEAQYGDFVDGAQIIIDEFLVSGRAKWGQTSSLTMLLPHGFEGQGPDHSSGLMERFLSFGADFNIRIANCTTAAQYFHLLRRQSRLLESDPLPLIIMTPKSLLRHPDVASSARELAEGKWMPIIEDQRAEEHPDKIRRLVFCSGKVYVDLMNDELWESATHAAVVRIEQLYPVAEDQVTRIIGQFPGLEEVVWLQEEPENMGAWDYIRKVLETVLDGRCPIYRVSRPPSAVPSEGSTAIHNHNQRNLVKMAFAMGASGNIEMH